METKDVGKYFPAGRVLYAYREHGLLILVIRIFFLAIAGVALWWSMKEIAISERMINYWIVIFCLWRIHCAGDDLLFLCEEGIVVRRRPISVWETLDMFWDSSDFYIFISYEKLFGFSAMWDEVHIGSPEEGGLYIVSVDLQYLKNKDKKNISDFIEKQKQKVYGPDRQRNGYS